MTLLLALVVFATSATVPVSVEGPGYLRFTREGRTFYARQVELGVVDGKLGEKGGALCAPRTQISGEFQVRNDGWVLQGERKVVRLTLTTFPEGTQLREDQGLWASTVRGEAHFPGESGAGTLRVDGLARPVERIEPVASTVVEETSAQVIAEGDESSTDLPELLRADLQNRTEVAGDEVLLSDVAKLAGSGSEEAGKVRLGMAPPLDSERTFDGKQIRRALENAGFRPEWHGADRVVVRRASQQIPHERFVEVAREAAQKVIGKADLQLLTPAPALRAPSGETEIIADRVQKGVGAITVQVVLYVQGKRINSRTVRFGLSGPAVSLRVGQTVRVRVVAGGASIETDGVVKQLQTAAGQATIETSTGATLTGTVLPGGIVEVQA